MERETFSTTDRDDASRAAHDARRASILSLAQSELDARVRRRRMARATLVAVPMIGLACALALRLALSHTAPGSTPHATNDTSGTSNDDAAQITPDAPSPAPALARQDAPPTWTSIDDDQLLALLAEAGRPSGLVRRGGQVIVVEYAPRGG
ncbi:MAG: hypothetical protein RBS39_09725 [Phycisphaerales bacterium]|jgi:hypothetical protein|nr:hypothetical protein [Phycisphaerales bacterium]